MIQLDTLIQIGIGVIVLIAYIVTFFVMQTRQNMKIEQLKIDAENLKKDLEKDIEELQRKQSVATSNQIKTEKDLVGINVKLEQILEAIKDLKANGHP